MPQTQQFTVSNIPFTFSQDEAYPTEFPVLLVNQYNTWQGPVEITDGILDHMEHNFNQAIPHDKLPIDEGHVDGRAPGWIEKVMHKVGEFGNGLYVQVDWNKYGKELLADKNYRYVSADFWLNYIDSEFGREHGPTLLAVALTNRPMLESLPALFSKDGKAPNSQIQRTIINFSQKGASMDLNEILAKSQADWSDEEKAFVATHAAELTDEQRTQFGLTESGDEGNDEGADNGAGTGEGQDEGNAEGAGSGVDAGAGAGEGQGTQLSQGKGKGQGRMVQIPEAELEALKFSANRGAEAAIKLEQKEAFDAAGRFVFSKTNSDGLFLEKSQEALGKFLFSLNADQRKAFDALMATAPKGLHKFTQEEGDAGKHVNPTAQINDLVASEMATAVKAGTPITFSQALDKVKLANPDIFTAEYGN